FGANPIHVRLPARKARRPRNHHCRRAQFSAQTFHPGRSEIQNLRCPDPTSHFSRRWGGRFRLPLIQMKILLLLFASALFAQDNIPKGMKQYFFGFLVKGEKYAQTMPKADSDR